ncbi:Subtilisin-like protease 2 [Seminavis robusta]|uniref:subtilisin n=1 Tax=Seminavis robusta TaxID=568900 RepID=A0A9N8HSZ7_9STRA|nr:Subtilisin-like protease 2 [Seminavis robusta]|eukprot:Sro1512_g278780.1 Subtilisin-like protease 2 (1375) ;mRNA; f:1102-5757
MLHFLSVLLIQALPLSSARHRDGGQPVPVNVYQEARRIKARYQHWISNPYRRQQRKNGRDLENASFSAQLDHLFDPVPQADNEHDAHGGPDTTANTISLRQVGLEGSAQPLFFCSPCTGKDEHAQEECARCKGFLHAQHSNMQDAIMAQFPQARIVAKTTKLINMVFVEYPVRPHDDLAEMDHIMSQIPGVLRVMPQEDSTLDDADAVEYLGGGAPLEAKFCGVGGKGVRMAILDSGIDYTHKRIGGSGTVEDYELAYGTEASSTENKQVNPAVFPTNTVIGGRDFLGESFVHTAESLADDATPDDNPVDANRHGTMVADAVLSVAPQTQLLACKVCTSDTGTCPGFAVLQALEYALDPNEDDNMDDKVDIVNLSLGGSYLSSYYDMRTEALEKVFELGVVPVVAAGNEGNIPYIGGPGAKTPNSVAVAATNGWGPGKYSYVTSYSSRGPGDLNNLKPDISAPSGLTLAAFGTGTDFYRGVQGTSFAAPVVAGALSLVKERCPSCSPFALKSILLNNAKRHVQYNTVDVPISDTSLPDDDAPNSLVGAGEVQLDKALDSDIWAYCVEDVQPTLSFGLINAHKQMEIKKTIRVINLSGNEQTLSIRNQFSSKKLNGETQENPLRISFSPAVQVLPVGCNSEVEFNVTMEVDASKAPKNRMTSGGEASNDPTLNDWNEFGGWVIIENKNLGKDVSLAYHTVIRQASDLKITGTSVIEDFEGGPTDVPVGLKNMGAGIAQVDAFEMLFTSEDDPEGGYGEEVTPSDFRYIGYRAFKPQQPISNCDYLLEFSFTTWEMQKRINLEFFQVHVDIDFDGTVDYILFNSGVFTPFTDTISCIIRDKKTNEIKCSGMPPDHSTNTANTILRVCSNDIGFATAPTEQQKINVYILTATATHLGVTEVTDRASQQFHTIEFPQAWMSAPSYDIHPGETLETLTIDGTGGNDSAKKPLGLILITNSYRGPDNTGAATRESEALILTNGELTLPIEVTPDELVFPVAKAFAGPECASWELTGTCASERTFEEDRERAVTPKPMQEMFRMHREEEKSEALSSIGAEGIGGHANVDSLQSAGAGKRQDEEGEGKCPEVGVPRSVVLRVPATPSPTQSPTVSSRPTAAPSQSATTRLPVTQSPTGKTLSPQSAATLPPPSAAGQGSGPTNTASPTSSVATTAPTTASTTTSTTQGAPANSVFSSPVAGTNRNVTVSTGATPGPGPAATGAPTTASLSTGPPTLSPSAARLVSVGTQSPTAQVATVSTAAPSAQVMTAGSTQVPTASRVVHVDTQPPVQTIPPVPAITESDNALLSPNPNAVETPVPTPLRGTPRPTGPITAAIVMYNAPTQTPGDTPPGLSFFSSTRSRFSPMLPLGLGFLVSGIALWL